MTRVQVTWLDALGSRVRIRGMIEDISPSGASLRIGQALPAGSHLEVHWPGNFFGGTVQNCRPSGMSYLVGIKKDPVPSADPPPEEINRDPGGDQSEGHQRGTGARDQHVAQEPDRDPQK